MVAKNGSLGQFETFVLKLFVWKKDLEIGEEIKKSVFGGAFSVFEFPNVETTDLLGGTRRRSAAMTKNRLKSFIIIIL